VRSWAGKQIYFSPENPAQNPNVFVPLDLDKTPSAAQGGKIAWGDVLVDDIGEAKVAKTTVNPWDSAGRRKGAVWVDGSAKDVTNELRHAGMAIASASPGMGAVLDELRIDLTTANPRPNANLRIVGRVNDLAYGNVDSRLERTLTTLQEDTLRGYKADLNGAPAAVALALHHGGDCGVSFVATVPRARRQGPSL
jgi:hypothetical protein